MSKGNGYGSTSRTSPRRKRIDPAALTAALSAKVEEVGRWWGRLQTNDKGNPLGNMANIKIALENDERLVGICRLNIFTGLKHIGKPPPWDRPAHEARWSDNDNTELAIYLQSVGINVRDDAAARVMDAVAARNGFHPVIEYLESLPPWDGIERIASFPIDFLDAEDDGTGYVQEVALRWMISGVARIYKPGTKVDHVLILEGMQGVGKSQVFSTLAVDDEWFSDDLSDLRSKEVAQEMRGKWIIELPELDHLSRSAASVAKAFITRRVERKRTPYAREVTDFPRSCIFGGTVNEAKYLKDDTGNRRFWPLKCGDEFDKEGLRAAVPMLWAEALHRYRAGEKWWSTDAALLEVTRRQQEERANEHPWAGAIEDYLDRIARGEEIPTYVDNPRMKENGPSPFQHVSCVSVAGVLMGAVGLEVKAQTKAHEAPVVNVLQQCKWWKEPGGARKRQCPVAGGRRVLWYPPGPKKRADDELPL